MLVIITLAILTLLVLILYFVNKKYTHWESSKIPHLKAKFPFGNLEPLIKEERSFGTAIYDLYKESKDQILGIYLFFRPAILVRDPTLIKNILTTDFEYFHDRGTYCDEENDPFSANLFGLQGQKWKSLRSRLTPAFTSGKLKGMFENIKGIGTHLVEHLHKKVKDDEDDSVIDLRDIASRYIADSLALIAFGLDKVSSIDVPDHAFRTNAVKLNADKSFVNIIRRSAVFICPQLMKLLRLKSLPEYMRTFCLSLVTETIDSRELHNIARNDLMQYLIELRNNNGGNGENGNIKASAKNLKSLSYEQIASNVFLFYIAGNESSSSTIAYTLYELTQNKELMERAKNDIRQTLDKHDGSITYESIMEMKFIDYCVKETLRKYPALPILNRECTKDYKVPGYDFEIKKGTSIIISLLGVSRDEKYFPNAEKYDPDRFLPERSDEFFEDMYMPFGAGPRNCIAFRMGILLVKIAIVMLLEDFNFQPLSIEELEFDHGTVSLVPKPATCLAEISKRKQ